MADDDAECGMLKELDEVKALLDARRDELFNQPLNHETMGRAMMLGAIDTAVWHLRRRLRPEE